MPFFRDSISDFLGRTAWLKKVLYQVPISLHPYLAKASYNGGLIFNL